MINGPPNAIKLARKLRREMSLPEKFLWRALRERPGGFKFRRQHPAGRFVLDFYCAKARLDVEIDGWAHDSEVTITRDRRRSSYLRSQAVATTRIPARLILDDIEAVVTRLIEICRNRTEPSMVPLHHPAGGPPPRTGEEA